MKNTSPHKKKMKFEKKKSRRCKEEEEINNLKKNYAKFIESKDLQDFSLMPLSNYTKKALQESQFVKATDIQVQSIGYALQGCDILGAAKTGSGKTLAFLIPLLERLYFERWTSDDGLGALVITPTRELAYQIFAALRLVGKYHDFSAGLVIGGKDLNFEKGRMSKTNILIATPGRLLQHLDENPSFDVLSLKLLVLDEADRILDMGFSETMNAIFAHLPFEKQTLLFSATQTKSVKDLARLNLKSPIFVSAHEHSVHSTPDTLHQNFSKVALEDKINVLWSFYKNHKNKKILVFVSSCKEARFLVELFKRLKAPLSVLGLYGTLHQLRRMSIYEEFVNKDYGSLIATDLAARGLDFPKVDWVLQLDCPEDPTTYLHRVGRTARNTSIGQSLLILTPSEEKMISLLNAFKIPIEEIHINPSKLTNINRKIEALVAGDSQLKEMASRAFVTYVKSIALMKNKSVFDASALDLKAYAGSYGLVVPPRVRYLEKRSKGKIEKVSEEKTCRKDESEKEDEEEENEDSVLTVKRENHSLEEVESVEEIVYSEKNVKPLTKFALAKKIIRKNIQANSVVTFDENGQIQRNPASHKVSEVGKEYDGQEDESGIDLKKAKEVLRAEDPFDRQLERTRIKEKHRDQRKKSKEMKNKRRKDEPMERDGITDEDEENENLSLDWLPDPDQVYGSSQTDAKKQSSEVFIQKNKRQRVNHKDLLDDENLALKLLQKIK